MELSNCVTKDTGKARINKSLCMQRSSPQRDMCLDVIRHYRLAKTFIFIKHAEKNETCHSEVSRGIFPLIINDEPGERAWKSALLNVLLECKGGGGTLKSCKKNHHLKGFPRTPPMWQNCLCLRDSTVWGRFWVKTLGRNARSREALAKKAKHTGAPGKTRALAAWRGLGPFVVWPYLESQANSLTKSMSKGCENTESVWQE